MNLQERINNDAEEELDKLLKNWSFIAKNIQLGDLLGTFTDEDYDYKNVSVLSPNENSRPDCYFMNNVRRNVKTRLLPNRIEVATYNFYAKIKNLETKLKT